MMKKILFGFYFACLLAASYPALAALPFQVTSSADTGNDTLRAVIAAANTTTGVQTITFAITTPVNVSTQLDISDPVIIEGMGTTVAATGGLTIFRLQAGSDGSILRGLCLVGAQNINESAIAINSGSNHQISGCCVGIYWTGGVPASRNYNGLAIVNFSSSCLIGGNRSLGEGNVFASNTNAGVLIASASQGNTLCGNIFGMSRDQLSSLTNGNASVYISGKGNYIGLPLAGYGNIIGGGTGYDVFIGNTSSETVIQNNIIGLNEFNTPRSSTASGINLQGPALVGGANEPLGYQLNVISGHSSSAGIPDINVTGSGSTIVGNFVGTNIAGTAAIAGSNIKIWAHGNKNWIGLPGTGKGNLLLGGTHPLYVSDYTGNGLFGNTICGFTTSGITLATGGNGIKSAPTITFANLTAVWGIAQANDSIEIFKAERGAGVQGGSLQSLGTVAADSSGNWSWPTSGLAANEAVCALATNATNNTSAFSLNVVVSLGTPTATLTRTCTATPTITSTYTATSTPTSTPTHTATRTSTFSPTATSTATFSPSCTSTATVTSTSTSSPTATISQTYTATNTITETATSTPTLTSSPTATASRTHTATGTITETATLSPTQTNSPTATPSPTLSPTATITKTTTPSPTRTCSPTATPSPTLSPTTTITETATLSPTHTSSPTTTPSLTISPTRTVSPTISITSTQPPTITLSATATTKIASLFSTAVLAYPNPGKAQIYFQLRESQDQPVDILIFNIIGEKVSTLHYARATTSELPIWDCSQAAPGIYLALIQANKQKLCTIKIAVTR